MRPLVSLRDLSFRVGVTIQRLREIAKDVRPHYREWPVHDKKGRIRILNVPTDELKRIQRQINRRILAPLDPGPCAHGGVPGRSVRTNARAHLGQRCVINLDVKSFFPSIRHRTVYRLLRHRLGFGHDVARLLTRLTTYDGQVPQGAPTSGTIANAVLAFPIDGPLAEQAQRSGVAYTRYVDDITLSGRNPRPFINTVARLLSPLGLSIHRHQRRASPESKMKIASPCVAQEVTGLIVNAKARLSVSRRRRDRVRAAIHGLRQVGDEASFQSELKSIRGRISHVRGYNSGAAERLNRYLKDTLAPREGAHQ